MPGGTTSDMTVPAGGAAGTDGGAAGTCCSVPGTTGIVAPAVTGGAGVVAGGALPAVTPGIVPTGTESREGYSEAASALSGTPITSPPVAPPPAAMPPATGGGATGGGASTSPRDTSLTWRTNLVFTFICIMPPRASLPQRTSNGRSCAIFTRPPAGDARIAAPIRPFCSDVYGTHWSVLGSRWAYAVGGACTGSPLTRRVISVVLFTCIIPVSELGIFPLRASVPQRNSKGDAPSGSLPPDGLLRIARKMSRH